MSDKPKSIPAPRSIISMSNPKLLKSRGVKVFSGVVHMLPAREYDRLRVAHNLPALGVNACPFAGMCKATCLNTAGRGGIPMATYAKAASPLRNNVEDGRFRRSHAFYTDRVKFLSTLFRDMRTLVRNATEQDMVPALRLNGTSDIDWSRDYPEVIGYAVGLGITLYDYTKRPVSPGGPVHHTYSVDVSPARVRRAIAYMQAGGNAAVVFATPKGQALPATWQGFPVIDGDLTDARFLDPRGVVVGLHAKGKAKRDRSGFVYPNVAT